MFLRYSANDQPALMNNPASRAYIRCLACRALSGHPAMTNSNISIIAPRPRCSAFFPQNRRGGSQLRRLPPIDTAHIEFAIVPAPL